MPANAERFGWMEIPACDLRLAERDRSCLLAQHDGKTSAAARAAGIDRMSIHKMLHRLGRANRVCLDGRPVPPGTSHHTCHIVVGSGGETVDRAEASMTVPVDVAIPFARDAFFS